MKVLLFALVGVLLPACRGGAKIEGTVSLAPITKAAPASNAARYQGKPDIGPADSPAAIVYLEGNFAPTASATNNAVEIGQKNYQFVPGILPIQKGSIVTFPNFDDDYHNVFSLSKPKRFDLGKYRKGEQPASQKFDQPGVVKLYCEIHEHMRSVILVLDTPHFTKTDKDGRFSLDNLPAGTFKLKAWLDEKVIWEKPVELKDGETLKVDFSGK